MCGYACEFPMWRISAYVTSMCVRVYVYAMFIQYWETHIMAFFELFLHLHPQFQVFSSPNVENVWRICLYCIPILTKARCMTAICCFTSGEKTCCAAFKGKMRKEVNNLCIVPPVVTSLPCSSRGCIRSSADSPKQPPSKAVPYTSHIFASEGPCTALSCVVQSMSERKKTRNNTVPKTRDSDIFFPINAERYETRWANFGTTVNSRLRIPPSCIPSYSPRSFPRKSPWWDACNTSYCRPHSEYVRDFEWSLFVSTKASDPPISRSCHPRAWPATCFPQGGKVVKICLTQNPDELIYGQRHRRLGYANV